LVLRRSAFAVAAIEIGVHLRHVLLPLVVNGRLVENGETLIDILEAGGHLNHIFLLELRGGVFSFSVEVVLGDPEVPGLLDASALRPDPLHLAVLRSLILH